MLVRTPLVETQQHGSVRVADLSPVAMSRSRFGLSKERLVPFETERNVSDADDCPYALHCVFPRCPSRFAFRLEAVREIFKAQRLRFSKFQDELVGLALPLTIVEVSYPLQ